jgi:hypothetical protein
MKIVRHSIEMGMVILLLTSIAFPSQIDQKLAHALQQNAQALRPYSWKSRTEIQKGGETKSVKLSLMRYGVDGVLQKTPVSSTPPPQIPTRGIRGLIAQKKKENFLETLDSLGALTKSYNELSTEALQRFMANATATSEIGSGQKLLRIKGRNVLQPGDSMTFWVDALTHNLRRIEIRTALDEKPVRVDSDFQDLPKGPTYLARSVVEYPGEGLTVITENFDYERVKR